MRAKNLFGDLSLFFQCKIIVPWNLTFLHLHWSQIGLKDWLFLRNWWRKFVIYGE